jgi:hypothetical protein
MIMLTMWREKLQLLAESFRQKNRGQKNGDRKRKMGIRKMEEGEER